MHISEYPATFERTCRELSVYPEGLVVKPEPEESSVTVEARLALNEHAYLDVHEVVVGDEGGVSHRKYGRAIVIGGEHVLGFDLDPSHKLLETHLHRGVARVREPAGLVTLREAIEIAWEATSRASESERPGSTRTSTRATSASAYLTKTSPASRRSSTSRTSS